MFITILIILGILLMGISSYYALRIFRIFSGNNRWFSYGGIFKREWQILPGFIIAFLIGYITYLVFYWRGLRINYEYMTAIIFFLGALFVLLVVLTNFGMFSKMADVSGKNN